jgi:hypothetical protein
LFELADRASSAGFDGSSLTRSLNFVSFENTRRAAAECDYLESHARRVYSCVATPQLRAARELAEKIKGRKVAPDGIFSCRDVYLKGWTGLDFPEAVRRAPAQSVPSESAGMGMSSRWLDWKPKSQILAEMAGCEPTKPSEPNFVGFDGAYNTNQQSSVGFVGAVLGKSQKIEGAPEPPDDPIALASLVKSMESVLKGCAVELWSDGERIWLVADEEDARKLKERPGAVYTAPEAKLLCGVTDLAAVRQIHLWKQTTNSTIRVCDPRTLR